MDIESRNRWVEYSKAKDIMFAKTHSPDAPWFTVEANDKRRARLNCIRHLLSKVPYEDMTPPAIKLPGRPKQGNYKRPPSTNSFSFRTTTPLRGDRTLPKPGPGSTRLTGATTQQRHATSGRYGSIRQNRLACR